jgi:predicted transcriptional regulator
MDFREMIKERGLKITWLADNIGISQPLLSMYLSGKVKMPEIVKEKLIELLK